MKVIITGATGMVGKGVLLECLDHPQVKSVLTVGRKSTGMDHPKLKELEHGDFNNFHGVSEQLRGYDACFFCLGISAASMSEEEYSKITYGFTLSLANALYKMNPQMTFTYVSGEGTDSTEKGRMMWARVKGKTENDLLALGFKQAYMFRPGAIIPLRGIKSRTKSYQFINNYFGWLIKGLKILMPNSICNTTQIGLAMINVTFRGYSRPILRPKSIIEMGVK